MHKENGFSLIEVLVSIFILAIGLLGAASLQITGLQASQSSYLRTQATVAAYDIADRMRANPTGVNNDDYDQPNGQASNNCQGNGCTPQQMARNDFFEWQNALSQSLPNGAGVVCIDSTPATPPCDNIGPAYAIRVTWIEGRQGVSQSFTTSVSF